MNYYEICLNYLGHKFHNLPDMKMRIIRLQNILRFLFNNWRKSVIFISSMGFYTSVLKYACNITRML